MARKNKRFRIARRRMMVYVGDIRAIQKKGKLDWKGAQAKYREAKKETAGKKRSRLTRVDILNIIFRRIGVPTEITIYPVPNDFPPPLYDAFTVFDDESQGGLGALTMPIVRSLRAGASTVQVDFEEITSFGGKADGGSGLKQVVHPIEILIFDYDGSGEDTFKGEYYQAIREYIKSLFGDDSPPGSCRLYSLTHVNS
jgi:hypothetical protein